MINQEDRSVMVAGEERPHPSVRILARACIALAQERIAERKDQAEAAGATKAPEGTPSTLDEPVVMKATKKPGTAKRMSVNGGEGTRA